MKPSKPSAISMIKASGFFALRTPLLPVQELLSWSEELKSPTVALENDEALESAIKQDKNILREHLQKRFKTPELKEALFVASPSLFKDISIWHQEPESKRGVKVERALVRYFSRMTTRPTPFGLFAGCSVGKIAEQTKLFLCKRNEYKRHTRLDMYYLCNLSEILSTLPEYRHAFRYFPSNSFYRMATRLRYIEAKTKTSERSYHLVSLEPTEYLEKILKKAKQGLTITELAKTLVDDEISLEEGVEFIETLIENQILVSDLEPPITGPEPIYDLCEKLVSHPLTQSFHASIQHAKEKMAFLDQEELGTSLQTYHEVAEDLKQLPCKVELPRLFQVDLIKPMRHGTLSEKLVSDVIETTKKVHKILSPVHSTFLTNFIESFQKRYDGQELPLMEVLDEENGIGFGPADHTEDTSSLLEEIEFAPEKTARTVSWEQKESFLLHKLHLSLQNKGSEVILTEADLKKMESEPSLPLPKAFAAMITLAEKPKTTLQEEKFCFYFQGAMGPSGAKLLGRFCHADPVLETEVRNHLQEEEAQHPSAIFAEIVHLPHGRIGNVICRPILRSYEIPFLGRGGAKEDKQIPVTDLLVSVQGNRVILRSKRLEKEIIPCLTNAHNFAIADVNLYRFLCILSEQNVASGIGFSWGILESASYLPRVSFQNAILSLARWRIKNTSFASIVTKKGAKLYREIQILRTKLGLPRWVVLVDSDNLLPVDLQNILSIESFCHSIKNREDIILRERFPEPDMLCVKGPEGTFTHEIIIPMISQANAKNSSTPISFDSVIKSKSIQRTFSPGSECLYAKLYTGVVTSDEVLSRVIGPVAKEALERGAVDHWFFIRYADPDWHLRFRLFGDPKRLLSEVFPRLQLALTPLQEEGKIFRFQIDTYERELERYGGEGIIPAEKLFWADSEAVLEIVETLYGDEASNARWQLTLKGIDLLLEDFGFSLQEKLQMMQYFRTAFAKEFQIEPKQERQLDATYRKERSQIESILDVSKEEESFLSPGIKVLRNRSKTFSEVANDLRKLHAQKKLSVSISDFALSAIHMHANRLLRAAARTQELVIYDFLRRYYLSQEARSRKNM